jgi:hypothetical protein
MKTIDFIRISSGSYILLRNNQRKRHLDLGVYTVEVRHTTGIDNEIYPFRTKDEAILFIESLKKDISTTYSAPQFRKISRWEGIMWEDTKPEDILISILKLKDEDDDRDKTNS